MSIPTYEEWRPLAAMFTYDIPEEGDLIGRDLCAWRVINVNREAPRLPSGYEARVILRREYGPERDYEDDDNEIAFYWPARVRTYRFTDDRVALCSCCGNPAPCHMQLAEQRAAAEALVFEKRLMRVGDGVCYACGELITTKQEVVTMPEDNVDIPGYGPPTFHTRRKCRGELDAYKKRRDAMLNNTTGGN